MLSLNFTPFPTFFTERLILRQLLTTDDAQIFTLRSDDQVNKYLDRTKATSIEDARQFIRKINVSIGKNEAIYWGITLKDNPSLIGTVALWNILSGDEKAEIGYELLPEFQGKGIMQEAIAKVIEFGFLKMKLQTVEACTHPLNDKSSKLLERFHFKQSGVLENENKEKTNEPSLIIYSLTKDMYRE